MIRARAEEKVGGKTERRRVEARIGPGRRGFAGCLAAGGEGAEMKAKLWSLPRRRMGSCRGCMMEGEVEGRLASLEGGYQPRCGGEVDQAIACLTEGVEAELAKQQRQALVEEAAVAEEGSLVASLTKESRLDQHCQWIRIGEEILGGVRELHYGKSSGVLQLLMKVDENRRMVFGSATPAYRAPGPRFQGRSFACCTASPGYRPMLSGLPCGGLCPVAWQRHPYEQDYLGLVQV